MRKQKGFTLIELLVVIAIIGILAAIVLVSLSGARDRAKDARIMSGMGQLRAVAEIHYNDNDYSYAGLDGDTDWTTLEADVNGQSPGTAMLWPGASGYCAYIELNSGEYYCVDGEGRAKTYAAAPSTTCADGSFSCE